MKRFISVILAIFFLLFPLTAIRAAGADESVTLTFVDMQKKPVVGAYVTSERLNPPELLPGHKRDPAIGDGIITDANGQIQLQGYLYPHDQVMIGIQDQYICLDLTSGGDKGFTLPLRPNPTPDPEGNYSYASRRKTDLFVVDVDGNPVSDLVIEGVNPVNSAVAIPAKKTNAEGVYSCGVLEAIGSKTSTGFITYQMTLTNPYAQPDAIKRDTLLKMGVFLRSTNYEGKLLVTYVWDDEKPVDSLTRNQNKSVLYFKDSEQNPVQGIEVRVFDKSESVPIMKGYTDYGGKFIILGDRKAVFKVRCTDLDGKMKDYTIDTTKGGDLAFPLIW